MRALALALVGLAAFFGWAEFRFLTDDAYITFRYAHNHLEGWGYTWNPPPFGPVEGYTSFLWLILLEGVWWITGIEPPLSANWISLGLSLATLAVGFAMVRRLRLPATLEPWRFGLALFVLLATLSNRTFLTWMSGGLETALNTLLITAWCWMMLEAQRQGSAKLRACASLLSGLAAVTRPDGLLLVVASAASYVVAGLKRRQSWRRWPELLGLMPVPMHFAWRRIYYGEWLPNTYYAKHVAAWPESGARYLASFVLEYAWWLPLLLALAAMASLVQRRGLRAVAATLWQHPAHVLVVGTLLAHLLYYTFIIGGDHFEYRVYSHLVLLGWIGSVSCFGWMGRRAAVLGGVLGVCWVLSLPVPWLHHWLSQRYVDHPSSKLLFIPLERHGPALASSYLETFDELQAWLIRHYVCLRHREHLLFHEFEQEALPERFSVGRDAATDRPVMAAEAVGMVGWVLPYVAIIDVLGLSDRVIAHHGAVSSFRRMAHERVPPPGYVECFRSNVTLEPGRVVLEPREKPLRDAEIRECEASFTRPRP